MTDDTKALRERHYRNTVAADSSKDYCVCKQSHPCDAIQMADQNERLQQTIEFLDNRADTAEALLHEAVAALADLRRASETMDDRPSYLLGAEYRAMQLERRYDAQYGDTEEAKNKTND